MKQFALPLCLALASPVALAEADQFAHNTIDLLYSHLKFTVDGVGDDLTGPGYGVRIVAGKSRPFFTAEYQHSEPDGTVGGVDVEAEVDQWRAGLGYRFVDQPGIAAWGRVEYLSFDGEISAGGLTAADDEDGYGIHLGVAAGSGKFYGYVEAGYLKTDETDGWEARAGAAYQLEPVGLFLEYRRTEVETDNLKIEETYSDIRGGARFVF
jgi:hypothetical protein